jgi:pimeloyl-ACP methyl ester carboxylesterase
VQARALCAALPNCVDFTELPGVGHMTPVEAPERVTGKIRELAAPHLGGPQAEPQAAPQVKEGA